MSTGTTGAGAGAVVVAAAGHDIDVFDADIGQLPKQQSQEQESYTLRASLIFKGYEEQGRIAREDESGRKAQKERKGRGRQMGP